MRIFLEETGYKAVIKVAEEDKETGFTKNWQDIDPYLIVNTGTKEMSTAKDKVKPICQRLADENELEVRMNLRGSDGYDINQGHYFHPSNRFPDVVGE